MAFETQAVYFMRTDGWTKRTAEAWLRAHDYHPIKPMHAVGHEMRYRMTSPRRYSSYKTIVLDNGVHLVRGKLRA